MSANIYAAETAKDYGIDEDSCVDYVNDTVGNAVKYECMSEAITSVRKTKTLDRSWKQKSSEDFKSRGSK